MFKKPPQINKEIFKNHKKPQNERKTHGDVWQDKDAVRRVRARLRQPVTVVSTPRTHRSNTKIPRTQNHVHRRKLHQVASWVEDPIMLQLQELSRVERLSMSQTIRGLLKEILRQKFHQQHAATLPELIEKSVAKSNRTLAKRIVAILIRIAFDSGQTRVLSTNILGMQPGMTDKNLKAILDMGDKRTKANLTRKTTQLKELEDAIERYLLEEEQEDHKDSKEGRGK
jgi:hypothetical protein